MKRTLVAIATLALTLAAGGCADDGSSPSTRELGLHPRVVPASTSACVPARTVVHQLPASGTELGPGGRVRLLVNVGGDGRCGLDLPAADPSLTRVGERFVGFARNTDGRGGAGVPADTPVELFVGGVLAKEIPSSSVDDRDRWRPALAPLVRYPGPIAVTTAPPSHPCLRGSALPERLGAYRAVTLTPDEDRDCTSYFALQLFVNDVDQVVAANVVRAEP